MECSFSFGTNGSDTDKELLQLQPNLISSSIKLFRKDDGKNDEVIELIRSNKTIEKRFRELKINENLRNRPEVKSLEFEVLKSTKLTEPRRIFKIPQTAKHVGASLRHFLPSTITVSYDVVDAQARRVTNVLISQSPYWNLEKDSEIESYINEDVKNILLEAFREVKGHPYFESRPKVIQKRITDAIDSLEKDFSITNIEKCYRIRIINQIVTEKLIGRKADLQKALKGNKEPYITIEYEPYIGYGSEFISNFFKRNLKYHRPIKR